MGDVKVETREQHADEMRNVIDGTCPRCGEGTFCESVDVGVGVMHGPYGCGACGWSDSWEYDWANPARHNGSDSWGGVYPEVPNV